MGMRSERIRLFSSGVPLAGILTLPDDPVGQRPAVVLAHGYANYKGEFGGFDELADVLGRSGYVALQFDFRGCGESAALLGKMLCATEWPLDVMSAVSYLQARSEVDPQRIGLVGQSMGGGVVATVSALDDRVACTVSLASVSDGARWLHETWTQRRGASGWNEFLIALQNDRHERALHGRSRFAPLPELLALTAEETATWLEMRARYPLFLYEAPWESIDDVLHFKPIDVVQHIQCPIRFVHGTADLMVDSSHSVDMHAHAGSQADLQLIDGADHALPIGTHKGRVQELIAEWLDRYLK